MFKKKKVMEVTIYRPVDQREFDHQIPWYNERINFQNYPLIPTCAEHMPPTQYKLEFILSLFCYPFSLQNDHNYFY